MKFLFLAAFTACLAICFRAWSQKPGAVENTDQSKQPEVQAAKQTSPAEIAQEKAKDRRQSVTNDRDTEKINKRLIIIGWVQACIFALQLLVFGYQAWELRKTIEAAADQSADTKRSIEQATRAADAMERFASSAAVASNAATESVTTTKDTMTRLLRAYLCVNFGAAAFQKPETGFRFEVQLHLINAGQTPGYKVGYRARADVLPFPLPQDFAFPSLEVPNASESTLGNGQHIILNGIVHRIYSEEEVAAIKSGSKRLYMFGTATYEDVYRVSRYTNFCFSILWLTDGNSMGIYTKLHNDAN